MGVAVPSNRMGGAALRTDVAVPAADAAAIADVDAPPNKGDDAGDDDDVVGVVVVVRQTASLTSVKVKGNVC